MQVRGDTLDVGLRLLDHQLIDSDGVRCGKIDDVVFEESDGDLAITFLLTGPRAQRRRLPRWMRRAVGWLGQNVEHRVEWDQVSDMGAAVELASPGADLGLGEGDRKLAPLVRKLPRS